MRKEVLLLQAKKLGNIAIGQDGVVFHDYLFRFNTAGVCNVYSLKNVQREPIYLSQFVLDKAEIIAPHSNSVAFGSARYCEEDEFPLLYSNIYNNYAKADDPMKGVTCVYRLERNGEVFSATLVQLIEIGFVEDTIWRSAGCNDVRPYGNFAIDTQYAVYYAFVMRDEEKSTSYFAFALPGINDGTYDPAYGVKRVRLEKDDIISQFDTPYHRYVQGACFHKGKIYSLEGFTDDKNNPPAVRVIDVHKKTQAGICYFADIGLHIEPELIDFADDICYYADHNGNLFELKF